MAAKEEFKELYSRYLKKYFLKCFLYSIIISLSFLFALTLTFWLFGFKYYWIAFIAFAVCFGICFAIIYLKNKPNEKDFFKALEELDLEQRAITMYEFKDDESIMAKKQRENAIISIKSKDIKCLKIMAPLEIIIIASVLFVFSIASSIAAGLSANKIIPSANQAINDITDKKDINEYEISFEIEGDGYIDGEIFQLVKEGEDALAVYAEPEDGWYFYSWGIYNDAYGTIVTDDLNEDKEAHNPYKLVSKVDKNVTFYAVFKETDESADEGESEPNDQKDSQTPQKPSDEQQQQGQTGNETGGSEGGGKREEYNQVIDGETYYGDTTFDNAYNDAMEQIQQDGDNTSDELKKIIGDYYETIEK